MTTAIAAASSAGTFVSKFTEYVDKHPRIVLGFAIMIIIVLLYFVFRDKADGFIGKVTGSSSVKSKKKKKGGSSETSSMDDSANDVDELISDITASQSSDKSTKK